MKSSLSAEGFDVVYDINGVHTLISAPLQYNKTFQFSSPEAQILTLQVQIIVKFRQIFSGREAVEVEPILDALPKLEQ